MVILALETATRRGSVALCDGDVCVARDGDDTRTHGERLPNELLDWLTTHGRRLDDVDAFAVVTGPGSFTGLRVGVAAIQGLALAAERRVVGVPTLEAIAAAWLTAAGAAPPIIVPCLDGQRGDIFIAAFDASDATTIEDCRVLIEPRVGKPEESASALAALAPPEQMTLVGNGAQASAEIFRRTLPGVRIAGVPQPIAEAAARIATRRVASALRPHALRPIYLRRPDAELARDRAAGVRSDGAGDRSAGPWRIAVAETADLTAVEALQRRAFTNPWGKDAIKWELENTDVARLYVMRDTAGTVVAYCACWKVFDELHINSLAVEESLRRRGLARRLLYFVILDARAAGAQSATLEVRQSNQAARLLYEGLGFRVEGVRRDYYQDPREDALILWHRDLASFAP
ncbi:MAG TPA: tRNA (adenosine(37)-N6)-threonylcarbamoyltransferase complex dimerization subunit type 1 TsaB [Vicinamibacterales bacterium]|nr:tRNA (adenosine(37)-N6)-threonylcarbamoyltransferase complex dimerization subunit type 1 TsaB [Vicinamibacterales bacterium]